MVPAVLCCTCIYCTPASKSASAGKLMASRCFKALWAVLSHSTLPYCLPGGNVRCSAIVLKSNHQHAVFRSCSGPKHTFLVRLYEIACSAKKCVEKCSGKHLHNRCFVPEMSQPSPSSIYQSLLKWSYVGVSMR